MSANLAKLRQTELLRLVNSTPLGTVLTRASLRRQMDDAATRIGDGSRVHLLKYVGWLIAEHERPGGDDAADRYVEGRRKQAERNRAGTKAAQDIAPIPDVEDLDRRQACGKSFRKFCETYFPASFHRAWSADHIRVIAKIEKAVRVGGLFAFAMPRGSGKTTLARCAALWALLYGYRPFVCLIAGSQRNAQELLRPVRLLFLEDPLLLADFPEAVYPLRRLENSSKRQGQQHVGGKLTHVYWGIDKIVMPTIATEDLPSKLRAAGVTPSPSAGAVLSVTSLDSHIRGQQHMRPDRTIIRPSLVLLDDPQTRESARSVDQTRTRMNLLASDVMGLAGPGQTLSVLLTCTVMYERDLADTLLDREKSPEWESERTKLVYAWPADQELWDRYAEIRRTEGPADATRFYRRNRAAMDAGANLAWAERFDAAVGEISAVQHAVNLRLRMGNDGFSAECQNEPVLEQLAESALTMDQVLAARNGLARGDVPGAATRLTMFVDVHDALLYWCVSAWEDDLTGCVIDYGTFPPQTTGSFTLANAPHTLGRMFPGTGADGAIFAGLERFLAESLARTYKRAGGLMRIDRIHVDAGYKPGIVGQVIQKLASAVVTASLGVGIRASRKPIAMYQRKPGETIGHYWYVPNVIRTNQFRHVLVDVNYWKSFAHTALAMPAGERGRIAIYGGPKTDHELFAEHVARSERWVEVTGPYGTVHEWLWLPSRPDNHWLDCLVGCAAAASVCGAKGAGQGTPTRVRKHYTQADLRRK